MPAKPSPDNRRQAIQRLRARLARETAQDSTGRAEGIGFGLEAVDRVLPGGLVRRGVHELCGPEAATLGLGAVLLGRFAADGPVVWIRGRGRGDLYAPGLAGLGLAPERLIVVRTRDRDARLWALEEVLRSAAVSAGLVEIDRLGLTQGRRLQLAAEAGGTAGLLLRPEAALAQPGAARTRWRVAPLERGSPAGGQDRLAGPHPPGWALELVRCRSGGTGRWRIEWRDGGLHDVPDPLVVAAPPLHRPARAGSA